MSTNDNSRPFKELCTASEQFKIKIDQYISTFSRRDYFTFSAAEERKKQYTSAYNRLSLDMPLLVAKIESISSELAGLLIDADRDADEELATRLNEIFLAHTAFEEALAEFVERNEKELSSSSPSPAGITAAANKLITALDRLK